MRQTRRFFKQLELLFFGTEAVRELPNRPARSRTVRPSVITSDAGLFQTWVQLRSEYFPDRSDLDDYHVIWSSRRQKRVLASCNIGRRKVVVAREMCEPSAARWLAAVLYHELCHAVIGRDVSTSSGRRQWHGAQFRELEKLHPDIEALNHWISSGGWAMAVRSHRSRETWKRRRSHR